MIYSLSFSESWSVFSSSVLNTYVVSYIGSSAIFISTDIFYFFYTIAHYPSYVSFYSNFFTVYKWSDSGSNTFSKGALIAIICYAAALVLIIAGAALFLFRRSNMQLALSDSHSKAEGDTPVPSQFGKADSGVQKLASLDDDQWLWVMLRCAFGIKPRTKRFGANAIWS